MLNNMVYIKQGRVLTDSKHLAEVFGKEHKEVLKVIRGVIDDLADKEWGMRNFALTPYTHPQNKETYNMYELTYSAFVMVAMGFTGTKAMAFKKKYIEEFDRMQEELSKRGLKIHSIEEILDMASAEIKRLNEKINERPVEVALTSGLTMVEAFQEIPELWRVAREIYSAKLRARKVGKLNHAGIMTMYLRQWYNLQTVKVYKGGLHKSLYNREDLVNIVQKIKEDGIRD
jgi:Rha family phage regulatory protein